MSRLVRVGWFWIILAVLCSCAKAPVVGCPGASPSPEEAAYLLSLRQHHESADATEATDPEASLEALRTALSLKKPKGRFAEDAYLDTLERTGRLLLTQARTQEALTLLTKEEPKQSGLYAGSLQTLLGEVYQRRAKELTQEGDPESAKRFLERALQAFHQAARVHRETLESRIQINGAP